MITYDAFCDDIKNYFYDFEEEIDADFLDKDFYSIVDKHDLDFEIADYDSEVYAIFNDCGLVWDGERFECRIGPLKEIYLYHSNHEENAFTFNDVAQINKVLVPKLQTLAREIEDYFKSVLDELTSGDREEQYNL